MSDRTRGTEVGFRFGLRTVVVQGGSGTDFESSEIDREAKKNWAKPTPREETGATQPKVFVMRRQR